MVMRSPSDQQLFLIVWVMIMILAIGNQVRRRRRAAPMASWVRGEPASYSTAASVRVRGPDGAWHDVKSGLGSSQLVVRGRYLEVSLAGATGLGGALGVSWFLFAGDVKMWVDEFGWLGTRLGRRQCIRLLGRDANGSVELAISPHSAISEVWEQLLAAGAEAIANHE